MERLKSVLFIVVLAIFGLALTASPAMADIGPINNINPNNTTAADDHPWNDEAEGDAARAETGSGCMYMQIAYWLVDAGFIETSEDSQARSTESGNRERKTAAGETSWKD